MNRINYRPDIDALRGVAVLLVVIFHAFPSLIPGGFIGVDVFFVISGYLITSIILKSLEKGDFSIKEFYSKRVCRLFPSLIVVLLTALIVGWFILTPSGLRSLNDHIVHSAIYLLNYDLIKEVGYFDIDIKYKPLAHLWTLSVEEQYYIFWPILLLLIAKQKIITPVFVVGLVVVASFVANVYYIDSHSEAVYFHTLTRVWQLAVGSMLAAVMLNKMFVENKLIALTGVCLIVLSALFLTEEMVYPGWLALFPTIGAVLFIVGNVRFSQWGGMLNIGLISYPLYLWHWVIISFVTIYLGSPPDASVMIFFVALSFVLAWATYKYIEPIRYSKRKSTAKWLFILLILIGVFAQYLKENIDRPVLFPEIDLVDNECERYIKPKLKDSRIFEYCRSNNLESEKYIAVIGDSHAFSFYSGFARVAEHYGYGTILLGENSCPVLSGFHSGKVKEEIENCRASTNQIIDFVKDNNKINKILIVARGPFYIHGKTDWPFTMESVESSLLTIKDKERTYDSYSQAWSDTLKELRAVDEIYYLAENPELDFRLTFALPRLSRTVSRDLHKKRMSKYMTVIRQVEKNHNLEVLNTTDYFCNKEDCSWHKGGNSLYKDDNHLSIFGSEYIAENIKSSIFNGKD